MESPFIKTICKGLNKDKAYPIEIISDNPFKAHYAISGSN